MNVAFAVVLASIAAAPPASDKPARSAVDAGTTAPQSAADEVKTLLLAQAEAWNRGDLERFCAVYADDATFLSPSGVTHGRDNVLARYKKRYPDAKAMGKLSFEFIELRPAPSEHGAMSEAVSVAAHWHLSYPDKPEASGVTLVVLHRTGASWVIVQDASM